MAKSLRKEVAPPPDAPPPEEAMVVEAVTATLGNKKLRAVFSKYQALFTFINTSLFAILIFGDYFKPVSGVVSQVLAPYMQEKMNEIIKDQVQQKLAAMPLKVDGGYPQHYVFTSNQSKKVSLDFYAVPGQEVLLNVRTTLLSGSESGVKSQSKIYLTVDGQELKAKLDPRFDKLSDLKIDAKLDWESEGQGRYHQLGITSPLFEKDSDAIVLVEVMIVVRNGGTP